MIRFGVNLPNHPGGDACRDGVGGDVLGDHGPGPDDGAVPDMYPRQQDRTRANPTISTDNYRHIILVTMGAG